MDRSLIPPAKMVRWRYKPVPSQYGIESGSGDGGKRQVQVTDISGRHLRNRCSGR
jgi:hypothetical protein